MKNIWSKIKGGIFWFRSLSIIKHILMFYFLVTLIGSLLLFTPQAHTAKGDPSYIDSLFVSASAFSDTGLSPVNTAETWSIFGQAVIAILILLGGIGLFALKVYFINILFGTSISFFTREALTTERGSGAMGASRRLIKISVSIMFIVMILASFVLSMYFYFVPGQMGGYDVDNLKATTNATFKGVGWNAQLLGRDPSGDAGLSIRYGIFHSISALNNAGFDIIGGHSIMGYYHNFGIQIIFIVLFVVGGIGYPVIYDVYLWILSKSRKETFRWSLFTKLSMLTYVLLTFVGIGLVFAVELNSRNTELFNGKKVPSYWNDHTNGTTSEKVMGIIFNTMSTRNAGFATIKMGQLSRGTLIIYTVLMFIGSAPSSTAGGIRTTTIAIIFMALWAKLRNRDRVNIFNKRIPTQTVTRTFIVFFVAIFLVVGVSVITISSFSVMGGKANADFGSWNPVYVIPDSSSTGTGTTATVISKKYDFTEVFFEVGSAFGTTGLSAGLTQYLSMGSKLSLIIIMFIGQLGISSSILVWGNKKSSDKNYSFVREDVATG